jgi:hypothetical protein
LKSNKNISCPKTAQPLPRPNDCMDNQGEASCAFGGAYCGQRP